MVVAGLAGLKLGLAAVAGGWCVLQMARRAALARMRRKYSGRVQDVSPSEWESMGFMDPESEMLGDDSGRNRRSAFMLKWIRWGKAEFPLLEFTEANLMMVTEELRKKWREAGVRDVWIAALVNKCAVSVIIPSREQLRARRLIYSADAQEALSEMRDLRNGGDWFARLFGLEPIIPTQA